MSGLTRVMELGTFLLMAGLHWGYLDTFNIEVTHTEIELPDLPAEFDGYDIILISCLHTDGFGPRERLLRSKLQALEADLLVVAGDFRKAGGRAEDALRACRRIFEGLEYPDGILATKGNHDGPRMLELVEEMGLLVLRGECYTVRRGGAPGEQQAPPREVGLAASPPEAEPGPASLTFVGVGDARWREPDWAAALEQAEPGGFRIGICHSPDGVVSAAEQRIPLVLCGHTHGGQVRLPGIGPLITETRLVGRRFAAGLCRYEDTLLYVNRGIGWTRFPVRINCRPEISVLTLRRRP